jgi:hypothetical protein
MNDFFVITSEKIMLGVFIDHLKRSGGVYRLF